MRIAIVRLSAMGDIINSAFILFFIKQKYPNIFIDWICEESFADILKYNPYINAIHTISLKKSRSVKSIKETIKKLKSLKPYDMVIDLQGLLKSAVVSKFLGKKRFGFDKNSIRESLASYFYGSKTTISYSENSIYRTAFLINDIFNTNITKEQLTHLKPSIFYKKSSTIKTLLKNETNIAFIIGSSRPYKNYPIDKIITTINDLNLHTILVWGSKQEYEDAQNIHKSCQNTIISPKLEFNDLFQLIDSVDLTIGGDTGPTHAAWALCKKSITLFGATSPHKMMCQTDINIAIQSNSKVNVLKINRRDFSIKEISHKDIIYQAKRLLNV